MSRYRFECPADCGAVVRLFPVLYASQAVDVGEQDAAVRCDCDEPMRRVA